MFKLSDYYYDYDSIYRGILREVYIPFACADDPKLVGADEATKKKYMTYYKQHNFTNYRLSVFTQYFKYSNVYSYLFDDGRLITLPPHNIRICGVAIGGEPVLEYDVMSVVNDLGFDSFTTANNVIDDKDLSVRLCGYPPEIAMAIRNSMPWVQLDPRHTFTLQEPKEEWQKYSVPMIASALMPLAKKRKISDWEDANLRLGMRSFVHVRYGDKDGQVLPNNEQLTAIKEGFKKAMTGSALVVTNTWAEADFIQPDLDELFHYEKYNSVNQQILAAGGISEIMVSGNTSSSSTFATAQVSMQTAAIRIKVARDLFCNMMNKINRRLNEPGFRGIAHGSPDKIPEFTFPPVDLNGSKQFQEICRTLYDKGVVSRETLLQTHGFDMKQEVERKKYEKANGIDEILSVEDTSSNNTSSGGNDSEAKVERGRPTLDVSVRQSDPTNSQTGRQPKPSNPEGSQAQTG